jgi:hypothetical protein
MPQSVVNMKVNTQNKISRNLKNNRFKMRHAPYSNRYLQGGGRRTIKHIWFLPSKNGNH